MQLAIMTRLQLPSLAVFAPESRLNVLNAQARLLAHAVQQDLQEIPVQIVILDM